MLARRGRSPACCRRTSCSREACRRRNTTYLHSGHGLTYDVGVATNANAGAGRPKYMSRTAGGIEFRLTEYMNKTSLRHNTSGNVVNCYDQASGVTALARLLGVNAHCRFMTPFGYINPSDLVGEGLCNNPFYPLYNNEKLTGVDLVAPDRSRFRNHMFASLDGKGRNLALWMRGDMCLLPLIPRRPTKRQLLGQQTIFTPFPFMRSNRRAINEICTNVHNPGH